MQPWSSIQLDDSSPPDLGGRGWVGTFVSFGPGEDVCQQIAKYQFRSVVCIQNTKKGGMFASFEGHRMLANIPFLETYFAELSLEISFGLPGPLQAAFELKHCIAYSKISARCDCANAKC